MLFRVVACSILFLAAPPSRGARSEAFDSSWTIRGGSFDGEVVAIDAAHASRAGRFWRLSNLRGQRRIVGWNPSSLPVTVAFRAGLNISTGDTAVFWSTLRQLEADMGMKLFQPAQLDSGADPDDVIVIDFRPMAS